jgi:hypothetical protein
MPDYQTEYNVNNEGAGMHIFVDFNQNAPRVVVRTILVLE